MQFAPRDLNYGVRTIFHISPSVMVAALACAERRQLNLQEWLDKMVVDACADINSPDFIGRLTDDMTLDLFAHVASHSPGLLTGRWKILFYRCQLEEALWDVPRALIDDEDDGMDCTPILSVERLRHRWSELLSSSLGM